MKVRKTWIFYFILLCAFFLRVGSEATASIGFLILAPAAFFGKKEVVQVLAFSWLLTMISPGIAPPATLGAVGRYAIIFCAAASTLYYFNPRSYSIHQKRLILSTVIVGLLLLVHSLFFSAIPDVSILKIISWTVTVTTLFAAWGGLQSGQDRILVGQIFTGLSLLMLLSLPLLFTPLGYLRNGHGFQGVLNHPQAFGASLTLLGIWMAMGLLTMPKPPWRKVFLFGTCLLLIVMSEARTAGFALVGGILISLVVTSTLSRRSISILFPGFRSLRVIFVLFVSLFTAIALAPRLVDQIDTYISKRGDAGGVIESYEESRGFLIDRMWANIQKNPMIGIGFGIASNPAAMEVTRDPFLNLPVGASIEKGVLPLAVLEELGIFGFLMLLIWGRRILRSALASGGIAIGLLGAIILLNFGESTFFSVGGMGMLPLVLFGWAATENTSRSGRRYA